MDAERKAINYIMAGGEGVRLRPLTNEGRSKTLLPIGESARCIDFTLFSSEKSKFLPVVAGAYGFLQLRTYLQEKNWRGILVEDSEIIGFGSILEHLGFIDTLGADFIIVSPADHIHYIDYKDFLRFHIASQAKATIVAVEPTNDPNHKIWVQENGKIVSYETRYQQKGRILHATGIFCFDGEFLVNTLKEIPIGYKRCFDITDLFRNLVARGMAFAYLYQGHWRDIGTLDRYYEENLRTAKSKQGNVFFGNNHLAESSFVTGCVFLGRVSVGKNSHLTKSILDEDVEIPSGVKVGYDRHEDERRNIIVTPKSVRVVSIKSKPKPIWAINRQE